MRSGVQDQPHQHDEILSLLKIQKLAGMVVCTCNTCSVLFGRLRQENCLNQGDEGCSEQRLHHCTPTWATEQDSVSKKKKKKKTKYFKFVSQWSPEWFLQMACAATL